MTVKPNLQKIEEDAIFHAIMTCLPAVTQAYRYFHAQGKTEKDFDRCAREAMTKAVRNAVELTAREVADPVWPYALGVAAPAPSAPADQPSPDKQGQQGIPHDFITHKDAWREAIKLCIKRGDDDPDYWEHELRAYDRAHEELAASPAPTEEPRTDGGEGTQ